MVRSVEVEVDNGTGVITIAKGSKVSFGAWSIP